MILVEEFLEALPVNSPRSSDVKVLGGEQIYVSSFPYTLYQHLLRFGTASCFINFIKFMRVKLSMDILANGSPPELQETNDLLMLVKSHSRRLVAPVSVSSLLYTWLAFSLVP